MPDSMPVPVTQMPTSRINSPNENLQELARQQQDTLLLMQRKLDLDMGARMSAALKGRVMISAGAKPYLAVSVKPGLSALDTLREALESVLNH